MVNFRHFYEKHNISIVVLLIIIFDTTLWINDITQRQQNQISQSIKISDDLSDSILSEMDARIQSLNLLTQIWLNIENESSLYDYDRYLKYIPLFYDLYSGFLAINWIDWNGTIRWIYPFEPNEGALNKNIRYLVSGDYNEAFAYAESTGNMGISGLIQFFQGGFGFTTYFPIIYNKNITGFFNGVFDFTILFYQLIESNESIPGIQDYSMYILSEGTELYHYNEEFTKNDDFIVKKDFNLYTIPIQILLRPNNELLQHISYFYNFQIMVVGLLLALIIGILMKSLKNKITIIKKNAEEKQKLMEGLSVKQKLNSLGTLAGGIAHDFNNLLGGIQGYTSLIELDLDEMENYLQKETNQNLKSDRVNMSGELKNQSFPKNLLKESKEYITHINEIISRSKLINKQILSFSHSKDVEFQIVDIHAILKEVYISFSNFIDKRINLVLNFYSENVFLVGDPTYFSQIFINLLINARDSISGEGSITISTAPIPKFLSGEILSEMINKIKFQNKFKLKFDKMYDFQISISDTGKGIPLEIQDKIYDPFFTTKKKGKKGTGLGLTIVHNFVSTMGGNINFKSEPTKGTTFKLSFPLISRSIVSSIEAEGEVSDKQIKKIPDFSKLTILIIEDEKDIRNTIKKFLLQSKAAFYESDDGLKGLQMYRTFKSQFSLIILDINLPSMNGVDVYHRIKEITPNQAVLFITGYSEKELPPMDEYDLGVLFKPFSPQSLIDRIQNWQNSLKNKRKNK
ncbi:ATP-binding protein [Candidatus Harpocratesius sp.]